MEFNSSAYMNDNLFLKYIVLYLLLALNYEPNLFALAMCSSHKTPPIFNSLRRHNIMPSLIFAGCTSLIQPLDFSINKPLKAGIRVLTDQVILNWENKADVENWSVIDTRVLTTWCVGDVWYQFCAERQLIGKRIFRMVELSLPLDGSVDH